MPDGSDFQDFGDDETPSNEELAEHAPRATDSANADAFVSEHGRGYLFVAEWESWLAWNGRHWERIGAKGRVLHAAMLTARAAHYRTKGKIAELEAEQHQHLLAGKKDEDLDARIKHQRQLLKWFEQSQNASRLEAVARLLETRLVVALRDLDRDPWLLNVANGTIDLRKAELYPHAPADLITQLADVEWDDAATCPTWNDFVWESMGGSLELMLYLQRLVGYAITGLTTEHILAFFYGVGRNGKSTFVQAIRSMLGEYACAAPRDLLFEDRHGQRHPEEIARLYGKRLAVCAEVGEHVTVDEAKVKDLTGGDAVSCRRMRENSWDLVPTHTLFLAGNHKPTVRGDDLGIWRRIRLVPWNVTVDEGHIDRDLPAKLAAERSGILRWAVNGCLEWQRLGLVEPEAVLAATREYREESDVLGEFLASYVVFGAKERCAREELRKRYEAWCEESGHRPVGARKLGQRLREKGCEATGVRVGMHVKNGWRGCRMKTGLEMHAESEPNAEDVS
jgi:putative DNA primase/helicase